MGEGDVRELRLEKFGNIFSANAYCLFLFLPLREFDTPRFAKYLGKSVVVNLEYNAI